MKTILLFAAGMLFTNQAYARNLDWGGYFYLFFFHLFGSVTVSRIKPLVAGQR